MGLVGMVSSDGKASLQEAYGHGQVSSLSVSFCIEVSVGSAYVFAEAESVGSMKVLYQS